MLGAVKFFFAMVGVNKVFDDIVNSGKKNDNESRDYNDLEYGKKSDGWDHFEKTTSELNASTVVDLEEDDSSGVVNLLSNDTSVMFGKITPNVETSSDGTKTTTDDDNFAKTVTTENTDGSKTIEITRKENTALNQPDSETQYIDKNGKTTKIVKNGNHRLMGDDYDSTVVMTYGSNGKLAKEVETNDDGSVTTKEYEYDNQGRLISEKTTIADSEDDNNPSVSVRKYSYDSSSNATVTDEDGKKEKLSDGRLELINVYAEYGNINQESIKAYRENHKND